jgi:hypothetical protein
LRCGKDHRPRGQSERPRNEAAKICAEKLNVIGLMPHPENLVVPPVGGIDGEPFLSRQMARGALYSVRLPEHAPLLNSPFMAIGRWWRIGDGGA